MDFQKIRFCHSLQRHQLEMNRQMSTTRLIKASQRAMEMTKAKSRYFIRLVMDVAVIHGAWAGRRRGVKDAVSGKVGSCRFSTALLWFPA
ncbi:hypothetical protein NAC44_02840 [Allorhizobium sp. BGMRC 0089]|uniref:hypothetical protein n=1 Tax=Allorhizobium sonneratiae TaxID=2934936 RepID=UPI00203336B1|nr:hypothetical protein [Allorhizobium sonneratiae]MCM2291265.1 hypothetical protein [Allorhizobium sonneratiae]